MDKHDLLEAKIANNYALYATQTIMIEDPEAAHAGLMRQAVVLFWDECDDFNHIYRFHLTDTAGGPVWYIPADNWEEAESGLFEVFPPELVDEVVDENDPDFADEIRRLKALETSPLQLHSEMGIIFTRERVEGVKLDPGEANKIRALVED